MEHAWTLTELVARASRALAAADVRAPNGRITEVPDARMIRWYTTSGLVDRPAMRGRVAYYGERHLLQLVAVKRLQAQGLTLAAIQQRLAGATEATLRATAGSAETAERADRVMIRFPEPAERPPTERPTRFWAAKPAATTVDTDPDSVSDDEVDDDGHGEVDGRLYGLRIADLTVLLRSPPSDEDLPAIRAAAQPLLDLLAAKHLISPNSDRKGGPA